MVNRREFLEAIAGAALAAGALVPGAAAAAQDPFVGNRAGQRRVVEGIRLRWCPPGRFLMGSPPTEVGHRPDEAQVEVTLTRGFWMGELEVTQREWQRLVGDFPAQPPTAEFGVGDDVPLYWVNFDEAEMFCARLTERAHGSRALPREWEFRLPTEAQWEYACRAGTVEATSFGDVLRPEHANFAAGAPDHDRRVRPVGRARPAGSYPANPWGIHDMHGNVWEWCRDWYQRSLPGGTDPDLREVPTTRNRDGSYSRVRRGGAWIEAAWACRSACRLPFEPPRRSDHIGFRVLAVSVVA